MRKELMFLGVVVLAAWACAAAPADSYATADSLVGKVEVQRAGGQVWTRLAKGDNVRNNDYVRAGEKSFARLTWSDGSASFLHENTQILLAFYSGGETNIISRHITVFYGAVFFVLKEILPKTFTKSYDVKIYTPTAVVSLRGTSLSVSVDNKSGSSTVEVITGTIMVRNILKNVSTYLSAGFKTTVDMRSDPIVPKPVLSDDIMALKTWVPIDVVDQQMTSQLARAGRDHEILTGSLKQKMLILPFVNSSKYAGPWNITSGIPRMLGERLQHAACTAEFADTPNIDPLAFGEKAKAKFVVTGEIQDFDVVQHAEIAATADEYREFFLARVRISVQMINVAEKKVVLDNEFTGDMRGGNTKDNSWQKIARMTFSDKDPQFSKSILGSALLQALSQSADQLTKQTSRE
jgi:hypothetical protein